MLDWEKPRKHLLSERSQADKVTHGMMDLWGDIQNGKPIEAEAVVAGRTYREKVLEGAVSREGFHHGVEIFLS